MNDAETYRTRALEFSKQAQRSTIPAERDHLLQMERSYLLLAKNAEWLERTDVFLREQRNSFWAAERPRP